MTALFRYLLTFSLIGKPGTPGYPAYQQPSPSYPSYPSGPGKNSMSIISKIPLK